MPIFKEFEQTRLEHLKKSNKQTLIMCLILVATPVVSIVITYLLSDNANDTSTLAYGFFLFSV